MQTEEDHQHHIEEVVTKEGGVVLDGVNPGTVDQPTTQAEKHKSNQLTGVSRLNHLLLEMFLGATL